MPKPDHLLGMQRPITRRDFVHGASLASLGLLLPSCTQDEGSAIPLPSTPYSASSVNRAVVLPIPPNLRIAFRRSGSGVQRQTRLPKN